MEIYNLLHFVANYESKHKLVNTVSSYVQKIFQYTDLLSVNKGKFQPLLLSL